MKIRNSSEVNDDISIISRGVVIEGKISSDGNIRIEGIVRGDLIAKGNVSIGESGEIFGNIKGVVINIGGKVNGSVNANEKLLLESNAQLKGDIVTKLLIIESGAKFDGKSSMAEINKEISAANLSSNEKK